MSVPNLQTFLVAPKKPGDARALLDFMKVAAEQHAGAVVVAHAPGGIDNPTRLVVRATQEAIQALEARYRDELYIEPDLSLKPS